MCSALCVFEGNVDRSALSTEKPHLVWTGVTIAVALVAVGLTLGGLILYCRCRGQAFRYSLNKFTLIGCRVFTHEHFFFLLFLLDKFQHKIQTLRPSEHRCRGETLYSNERLGHLAWMYQTEPSLVPNTQQLLS